MAAFATPEGLASHLQQDLDRATAELHLDIATGIVRAAIGQHVTSTAATAVLYVTDPCARYLKLPAWPVTDVTEVTVGGVVVDGYTVMPTELWRSCGWADTQTYRDEPVAVTVAYTAGYATAPDDVKGAALFVAGQFYANPQLLEQVSIDDYSATRMPEGSLLPQALVDSLRATYGTTAYVTGTR